LRGAYLMKMRHRSIIVLLALAAIATAVPARAQSDDDRYTIMRPEPGRPAEQPEPWLPPKYKSPRGTRQHIVTPRPIEVPQLQPTTPPPLYVPQTGQVLPNLPTISGAGPGGRETSQDRAVRCANQAGVYGQAAGDRNTYVGSCINQ
jgi:hypothetical protein